MMWGCWPLEERLDSAEEHLPDGCASIAYGTKASALAPPVFGPPTDRMSHEAKRLLANRWARP
jgi:hypothetical protein